MWKGVEYIQADGSARVLQKCNSRDSLNFYGDIEQSERTVTE